MTYEEFSEEQKQQDSNEPSNDLYTMLGEVKICPFTGKKYDAVIKVKCTCLCHAKNVTMMHFMPCCDNGYINVYRYID